MKKKTPFTIKTPRGTFTIDEIFNNKEEANKKGFGLYFTFQNKEIYTKSNTQNWHTEFGVVEN